MEIRQGLFNFGGVVAALLEFTRRVPGPQELNDGIPCPIELTGGESRTQDVLVAVIISDLFGAVTGIFEVSNVEACA